MVLATSLTVLPGFDPVLVAGVGATHVSLVATALRRIDPATFRTIVLGGAAPPADRPPNVVTTYGMTETGSGVVYDGRPLDGVEVRIDDGGQVHLRGPMLLRAYRDGADALDADGWLATGDIGRWLDDGRLHVEGRAGDLIITGGENVWPEPVEAALRERPGVLDVAVTGTPDDEWGHVVTAVVVPAARRPAGPRRAARRRQGDAAGVLRAAAPRPRRRHPAHRPRQGPPPRAAPPRRRLTRPVLRTGPIGPDQGRRVRRAGADDDAVAVGVQRRGRRARPTAGRRAPRRPCRRPPAPPSTTASQSAV